MSVHSEELRQEGNRLFRRGKFSAAIDKYTEAIVFQPADTRLLTNRALCREKLEDWAGMREDASKAAEMQTHNVKARVLLGVAECQLHLWETGLGTLQDAVELAAGFDRPSVPEAIVRDVKKRWDRRYRVLRAREYHVRVQNSLRVLDENRPSNRNSRTVYDVAVRNLREAALALVR